MIPFPLPRLLPILAAAALLPSALLAQEEQQDVLIERRAKLGLPADESVLCAKCHEGHVGPARDGEGFVHGPVGQGHCLSCHNPHASKHGALLIGQAQDLCFKCHDTFSERLESPFLHTPVGEGRCTSCHDPHRSELAMGLKNEGMDLCGQCHEEMVLLTETEEMNLHGPFVVGDCLSCHDPHAGQGAGNVLAEGAALCGDCHDIDDQELSEAHLGAPLSELDCAGCHNPHASPAESLIRPVIHSPFEERACDMCHDEEADDPRDTLEDAPDLCLGCHEDVTLVPNRVVAHEPVLEGMCMACHNPHASEQPGLLLAKANQVCLTCHDEIRQRADDAVSSHLSHDEGNCVACHTPHASAQPKLMKANIIGTCSVCHESHSNLQMQSHPMGSGTTDPRNGLPIDCLSCHGPHGTEQAFFLHQDPRRDLCVSCHDALQ